MTSVVFDQETVASIDYCPRPSVIDCDMETKFELLELAISMRS